MTETRHDLRIHFPEDGEILTRLKVNNPDFRMLSERYDTLDKEIHRIEAESEPASDERLEELKKHRLELLDEVAALIAAAH